MNSALRPEKPKDLIGEADVIRFNTTFWTIDQYHFIYPRKKVQIPFMVAVYCWIGLASARFSLG